MSNIDHNTLVNLILSRIEPMIDKLSEEFQESSKDIGVRYCVIDDLLPQSIAEQISTAFPNPDCMRLMSSFREKKYTSKNLEKLDPLVGNITFAIQDPRVVAAVEQITGIKNQIPDQSLYAGGLSAMIKKHYLGPHLDNSHDGTRKYYRTLNLLYYVTPDWNFENGGNLELWDNSVLKNITLVSKFNRMIIMETTPWSWHSVSEVRVERTRKCVSNYYFSPCSPIGSDYFNVTSFNARPEQPFRRLLAGVDNRLRHALRRVAPLGLGRKDVYRGTRD